MGLPVAEFSGGGLPDGEAPSGGREQPAVVRKSTAPHAGVDVEALAAVDSMTERSGVQVVKTSVPVDAERRERVPGDGAVHDGAPVARAVQRVAGVRPHGDRRFRDLRQQHGLTAGLERARQGASQSSRHFEDDGVVAAVRDDGSRQVPLGETTNLATRLAQHEDGPHVSERHDRPPHLARQLHPRRGGVAFCLAFAPKADEARILVAGVVTRKTTCWRVPQHNAEDPGVVAGGAADGGAAAGAGPFSTEEEPVAGDTDKECGCGVRRGPAERAVGREGGGIDSGQGL
mmetsp:Transcript_17345/g.52796  ORF Transcript_17345/g.52796 Transcript_17345/m.52796 type:complete len:288 (+) Transcript_17345:1283-2146(+)